MAAPSDQRLIASPTVTLKTLAGEWVASDLLSKRRFALSDVGAMMLAACMAPTTSRAATQRVAMALGHRDGLSELLERLRAARIVVSMAEWEASPWRTIVAKWSEAGWREAALYHMAAWDYPFVYYDGDGRDIDRATMRLYGAVQPDSDRTKYWLPKGSGKQAPAPKDALSERPFREVIARAATGPPIILPTLLRIVSSVFGKTAEFPTGNIRRTSPSGGARHPTEAYFLPLAVEGLAGWHHFAVGYNELQHVPGSTTDGWRRALYGVMRAPFDPAAVVVLASRFERNMYRYREPRTYRTVFMDAGHLTSSLDFVARSEGLRSFPHHGFDELALERQLGISGLDEGIVATIALG